jgi:preprotein translocase subunit SecE
VSFWQDLFQLGVYKRNQGRIVRQVTFAALAITLLLAAWHLWALLQNRSGILWSHVPGMEYLQYLAPALLLLVGLWISYRLVNYPQFADFLIAVEAEMNKVSWPSKTELIRSSLVVIFMMFFLAFVLFGFDLVWRALFQTLGVVK